MKGEGRRAPSSLWGRDVERTLPERWKNGFGLAVLVGEAPNPNSALSIPLLGRSGSKIASLADLDFPGEFRDFFDRTNLVERLPAPDATGRRSFPHRQARDRAIPLAEELRGRTVFLLGRRVARAFDLHASPWYAWTWVWRAGRSRAFQSEPDAEILDGLGKRRLVLAEVRRRCAFLAAVVPHPSGLSRLRNDPGALRVDRAFWKLSATRLRLSLLFGPPFPVVPFEGQDEPWRPLDAPGA